MFKKERFINSFPNKYVIIIGFVSSWNLYYNHLNFLGILIFTVIIFLLYINEKLIGSNEPQVIPKINTKPVKVPNGSILSFNNGGFFPFLDRRITFKKKSIKFLKHARLISSLQ